MTKRKARIYRQRLKYVLSDLLNTALAFLLFNIFRFKLLSSLGFIAGSLASFLSSDKILLEQIIVPVCLSGVYWLSGYYNQPFHKSRLSEFLVTMYSAIFNSAVIFLILLINDVIPARRFDYLMILSLFVLLLSFTYTGRILITSRSISRIKRYNTCSRTLIIGNSSFAHEVYERLSNSKSLIRNEVIGFVSINGNCITPDNLPVWQPEEIESICRDYNIEQIILAPTDEKDKVVMDMLDRLFPLDLPIKIIPDTLSFITPSIRINDILAEPLIDLTSSPMSDCEKNIKKAFDVSASTICLLLLSPLMAAIALAIKHDSRGPVFYSQTRIGKRRKAFKIYKFRSMRTDAEMSGPALSSENDHRITHVGHFLRKYRLDELPQFWNVLKGDMSIVGPRPEREFYIREIIRKAPYFSLVFQIRPGITSLGMVKFGYASDISEMVERTKYDLLYINNMSLSLDIKILIYTIRTVFTGRGI